MGASSEMFIAMRGEEIATQMYDSRFTKKDAVKAGENIVKELVESGNVNAHDLMANIVRAKVVLDTAETILRSKLPEEKVTVMGVTFTPKDGGSSICYDEDPVYNKLKKDLDDRAELLKLAQHQELVLDPGGNEVPKVSTKPRKSSINITF